MQWIACSDTNYGCYDFLPIQHVLHISITANSLDFEVSGQNAFEIPLGNVSHSITGKNEVTLEFHQNDDAAVSLMELRFHIPADSNTDTDTVQVN